MSDQGEPPPYPPPPPPPTPTPPVQQPGYGFVPHPGGAMVDVDPRSAGLERQERPGWALLFVVVGAIGMVGALFLPRWAEIRRFGSFTVNRYGIREYPGLFDTVDDVRGTEGIADDPGVLATAFFPWLAVVLTVLCILVALAAALGLRRAALTHAVRAGGVVLGLAAVALAVAAVFSLGFEIEGNGGGDATTSSPTSSPTAPGAPGAEPDDTGDEVRARVVPGAIGYAGWICAVLTLTVGCLIGPRIKHVLPDGATPRLGAPLGPPGAPAYPGGHLAPGLLRHRTHVGAVVVAGIGALLCLAGYTFLDWATAGDTVTFAEIGDDVRDGGGSGNGFAEAYFGFLGWLVLLAVLGVVLLVSLGLKPAGVAPRALRPFLAIGSAVLLMVHLGALVDLDAPEYGLAAWVVGVGLAAVFGAAVMPLRTTARMVVAPQQWPTGS